MLSKAPSSRADQLVQMALLSLCYLLGVERDVLLWCCGILHVAPCATSRGAARTATAHLHESFELGVVIAL